MCSSPCPGPGCQAGCDLDSGFTAGCPPASRPEVLRRLQAWGVDYVLGAQMNPKLEWNRAVAALEVEDRHRHSGKKEGLIGEFSYAARSRNRGRRVIARLEHGSQGADARFVVATLGGDASELYERLYCF